jgi:hypothetical protein
VPDDFWLAVFEYLVVDPENVPVLVLEPMSEVVEVLLDVCPEEYEPELDAPLKLPEALPVKVVKVVTPRV